MICFMSRAALQAALNGRDPIGDALRELVSVETWGDSTFVRLPLMFPGGTTTTVCISKSKNGYLVTDHGFAYRELEAIGAERSFGKLAAASAEAEGVSKDRRRFFVEVGAGDISRAVCDVAAASWRIVDKVYSDRREEEDEIDLEDELTCPSDWVLGGKKEI